MHVGHSYRFSEFLVWTRRKFYLPALLAVLAVVLYQFAGLKWVAIPWAVVALLGTATAFIVGFKNTQTYSRTVEAQQIWTGIASGSRVWGTMSRDFLENPEHSKTLIYRHLALLTAIRYRMRESQVWESVDKKSNAEYQRHYVIPERETPLAAELAKYLAADELAELLDSPNPATRLIDMQSKAIKRLHADKEIVLNYFLYMQNSIKDFYGYLANCERIKDAPYPRQYAIINFLFVRFFCLLLPFGMLAQFDMLNQNVGGMMAGHMIWLVIPFSVFVSWMYTSLDQVGESTENPFEGNANDVPISQICRAIEIDLRRMLGESSLPAPLVPRNNIIL
jgi:putative membrane protein